MDLQPGSLLGQYEISEAIGQGGMGRVYRAKDTRLGRAVAIKVLQPEVAADKERLLRFEREARLSSSLNHPSIITIFDFASVESTAYIAMELVSGESLRSLLRRPLSMKTVLSIGSQIAAGLAAAHRIGVVHRDLKPENVMITPQGLVKILDFGLAKAMASTSSESAVTQQHITHGPVILGTLAYMSPEQKRGEEVDFRSDQYSFGVILCEMLTGRRPDDAPDLDDIPEEIARVVERCLEHDRELRYGSTDDLAIDVMNLRDLRPKRVVPASRRPLWAAVAIAAILAALLVFTNLRKPTASRPPAYVALNTGTINISAGINNPVAISPDGRRLVIVGSAPGEGERLWLRDLSLSATTPIANSESAYSPAFSPDGKQIAYFANGKLRVVPVDGGAARTLGDVFAETSIAWNKSGTIVIGQTNPPDGPGLFKIDSRGGALVRLTRPDKTRMHVWPEFLPDDKHFLFIAGISKGLQATSTELDLMVGSVDGGKPVRIGSATSRVAYRNGTAYYMRDGSLIAQQFDPETFKFSGDSTVIADRVEYVRNIATASFAVADNGTIVWRTARGEARLLVLDRAGQQVGDLGRAIFAYSAPRIAPDGSRIANSVIDPKLGLADLWIYNLSGRAASRLTYETFDERVPVWSRDGRSIYYGIDIQGPPDIFKFDLETNRREPVLMAPGRQEPFDLSPDGRTLLYGHFNRGVGFDLRYLTLATQKNEVLVATPFDEADGRFSPDGKWVSFTSDASGKPEVYVMRFPSRGTPERVSSDGGSTARWRADRRELTFLAANGDMMSVAVSGSEFAAPKFLFRASEDIVSYELTPDGRRFVVRTAEINPPPAIQMLLR